MSVITLKKKEYDDIFKVEVIGKKNLEIYYNAFDILNTLIKKDHIILKYVQNKEVIGFVIVKIYENKRYHIMSIAVSDIYKKNNIGTKLIQYIKDTYDVAKISLYVQSCNTIAISFYKKNEFKIINTIEEYYKTLKCKSAYYYEWEK